MAWFVCLVGTSYCQDLVFRSLPELIESGSKAFSQGRFNEAAHAFNAIVTDYSEEQVWSDGKLPAKILPLAGFASYKSNLHDQAVYALETYLDTFAEEPDSESFARYTLASSLLIRGDEDQARMVFETLRQVAGHTPLRDLATLREGQLSQPETERKLLAELLLNPASPRLASYARLRLIQLELAAENTEVASDLLLQADWHPDQVPELASLSTTAAQIGDALFPQQPEKALAAYRFVQSKAKLLSAQRGRIEALELKYQQRAPLLNTGQSIWKEQFLASIQLLEAQLEQLGTAPDYLDAINIRKARCFSLLNRPIESWLLLEPIAVGTSDLAREAHLDWISCAQSMNAWNASSLIAQEFIKKYPNDEHIPTTLFWIALAQIEQELHSEAISSLRSILSHETPGPLESPSHYYIAYCHFMLGETSRAITSFENCIKVDPNLPIAAQAKLWIGICLFTTNELELAIDTFEEIEHDQANSAIHPEAAFRKTAARYALGELDKALEESLSWLKAHSLHPRLAEVRLLNGDILAELGRTQEAINAYAKVETADRDLTYVATEKQAALYLEIGSVESAQKILFDYRDRHEVPLEHIATYTQLLVATLDSQESQRELYQTIQSYGNQERAEGIVELIGLLDRLPTADQEQSILSSRIAVSEIQRLFASGKDAAAKLKSLELVSRYDPEEMPPAALLEAGKALADIGSQETSKYFQRILSKYPFSDYTDAAHFELAKYRHSQASTLKALQHLDRIVYESPETLTLRLQLEFALGKLHLARNSAELLLADRQALPQQKAIALNLIGSIEYKNENPEEAYNYHQRVFTLYRGETEQVAIAYLSCIQILESIKPEDDTRRLLEEFLAQADLAETLPYQQATRQWKSQVQQPSPSATTVP